MVKHALKILWRLQGKIFKVGLTILKIIYERVLHLRFRSNNTKILKILFELILISLDKQKKKKITSS